MDQSFAFLFVLLSTFEILEGFSLGDLQDLV